MAIRLHGGYDVDEHGSPPRFGCSSIAVSLGERPQTLVYPMPKRDNLIRLSIGCEDVRGPPRGSRARAGRGQEDGRVTLERHAEDARR